MKSNRFVLRAAIYRNWKRLFLVLVVFCVIYMVTSSFGTDDVTLSRLRHSTALTVKSEDEIRLEKLKAKMFRSSISTNAGSPFSDDFSRGQAKVVDGLLGGMIRGFFVDIGGGNGETNSVSYFFEKQRRWDGVLVEGSEEKYRIALTKNRQCILWNVHIDLSSGTAPLSENDIKVFELFRLINRTEIDLLIINLHDSEFPLLKGIDFGTYKFKAITIEMEVTVSRADYAQITDFLTARNYKVAHHLIDSMRGKKDVVYVHECVFTATCV